jgi:hypothetical protein
MKKWICTFTFILSVWSIQAADITTIVNAFKGGNAEALAGNMDSEVEIAVPGATLKGTEAKVVTLLARFFGENKPAAFSVVHHAGKKETGFLVGKLIAGKEELRVNITYCVKNDKALIQSIRIE